MATTPPLWIQKGVEMMVLDGNKDIAYQAIALTDPYLHGSSYLVRIKWTVAGFVGVVACTKCRECEDLVTNDDDQDGPGRRKSSRKRRAAAESSMKRLKREIVHPNPHCPVEKPVKDPAESRETLAATESNSNGKGRAFAVVSPSDSVESRETLAATESNSNGNGRAFAVVSPSDSAEGRETLAASESNSNGNGRAFAVVSLLDSDSDSVATTKASSVNFDELQLLSFLDEDDDCDKKMPAKDDAATNTRNKMVELFPKAFPDVLSRSKKLASELLMDEMMDVNTIMANIQQAEPNTVLPWWDHFGPFKPYVGMQVRKIFEQNRKPVLGKVVKEIDELIDNGNGELVRVWLVEYEDDDDEEMELEELRRYQFPRRSLPSCLGRPLQCLELFGGSCTVSEAFSERQWKVDSIDIDPNSNASTIKDILDVRVHELPFVPDFVWVSPDCTTYSHLSGRDHRSKDKFSESDQAQLHDNYLLKVIHILNWARDNHPHLLVCIENPVGWLSKMPVMQQFEKSFPLYKAQVDYCYFGRDEKKATHLWVNDIQLCHRLERCRCMAPFCDGVHLPVRGNTGTYDFSVIPKQLADLIAKYVDSKLFLQSIPETRAVPPKAENESEVNITTSTS